MQPVVILGAGINGAAVARDLALNGVPVIVVETGDIAQGATARSSRLIHGGLRYLEYRDIALVRESLIEREQLLQTAPHFVRPLRLEIPVRRWTGGLLAAAIRFCGLSGTRFGSAVLKHCRSPRGLIAVRFGLWLYDLLARGSSLPRHSIASARDERSHWRCRYWDAQLEFPERFVLSLLHDAQAAAAEQGVEFQVLTRHQVRRTDTGLRIERINLSGRGSENSPTARSDDVRAGDTPRTLQPAMMINATGAWGDHTLTSLRADEPPLFAGTRGSHLFSLHAPLRRAIGDSGIYAEAGDGRLVFILPLGAGVLVGTTDLPHPDSPGDAVATDDEVTYLIRLVNVVLPDVDLRPEHVELRHAGVRPLPRTSSRTAAAIPRGHFIHWTTLDGLPVATLIGGKLTTCRQLGAEVTDAILHRLQLPRRASTLDRPLPGAAPSDRPETTADDRADNEPGTIGRLTEEQIKAVRRLVGDRLREICASLEFAAADDSAVSVAGTHLPRGFVRWSIQREWVTDLNDLVERRLMLIFEPELHRTTLEDLADLLVEAGRLAADARDAEIDRCIAALLKFQGRRVLPDAGESATVAG